MTAPRQLERKTFDPPRLCSSCGNLTAVAYVARRGKLLCQRCYDNQRAHVNLVLRWKGEQP